MKDDRQKPGPKESRGHKGREAASDIVVETLNDMEAGEAFAGELADRIAARVGCSRRQAQRWMKVALAGPGAAVTKGAKDDAGTLYRLATVEHIGPIEQGAPSPFHVRPELGAILSLALDAGGEADLASVIASLEESTERSTVWAELAVAAAVPYLNEFAELAPPSSDGRVWLRLFPDVTGALIAPLLARPKFYVDGTRSSVQRALRTRLGAPGYRLTAGEAAIAARLVALGGTATIGELMACPRCLREAGELLAAMRADRGVPPWLEAERHRDNSGRRRYRLHAALWGAPERRADG